MSNGVPVVYDRHTQLAHAIDELERVSLQHPQAVCPVRYFFAPGIVGRECFTPNGVLLTSAIHAVEHLFVLSMGEVEILTEDGWQHLMSPYTGVTKAGTRRVVRTLDDTICTTFHPNPDDERDIAKLEARFYVAHNDHHAILAARRAIES